MPVANINSPRIRAALRELARFEDPSAWSVSRRGNLTRAWGDYRLTLFRRPDGTWGWCIANDETEERHFSGKGWPRMEQARRALAEELLVTAW